MTLAALESAFSSNPQNINAAHALIEGLRRELDEALNGEDGLNGQVRHYKNACDRMAAECERKDAALRWYADSPKPGEFKIVDREGGFISDLSTWGERARSALASTGAT